MQSISATLSMSLSLLLSLTLSLSLYFVSSYDFLIAFIISFQNMYGSRGSVKPTSRNDDHLRSDDGQTHTHTPIPLIDSAHPVGWAE